MPRRHRPRLKGADRATAAATLRRIYETKGVSIRALSTRLGLGYSVVRTLLLEAGTTIKPRPAPGPTPETITEMVRLYAAGHTLADIGRKYSRAPSTVHAWLLAAGVKMRQPGQRAP